MTAPISASKSSFPYEFRVVMGVWQKMGKCHFDRQWGYPKKGPQTLFLEVQNDLKKGSIPAYLDAKTPFSEGKVAILAYKPEKRSKTPKTVPKIAKIAFYATIRTRDTSLFRDIIIDDLTQTTGFMVW